MSLFAPAVDIRLKSILIATDFSEASAKPLHYAVAIARYYGADFCLAHVVSSLGFTLAGPGTLCAASDAVWRDARNLEKSLVQSGALDGLRHEIVVRQGNVWEQLKDVIRQRAVDLVVTGTHGRGALRRLLLGSVAGQIFRGSDCPVLTVGPGSFDEGSLEKEKGRQTLLFPTDFSDASLHALPYAVSAANRFGSRLVLFHVLPEAPAGFHSYKGGSASQIRENARNASLRRLHEIISCSDKLEVEPACIVDFGSFSDEILQAADSLQAEGIIMGLDGAKNIAGDPHMPWSTAYEIVRSARCPVLTVRG